MPATQVNAVSVRETCANDGGLVDDNIVVDTATGTTAVRMNGVDVSSQLDVAGAVVTSDKCGAYVVRLSTYPAGHRREAYEVQSLAAQLRTGLLYRSEPRVTFCASLADPHRDWVSSRGPRHAHRRLCLRNGPRHCGGLTAPAARARLTTLQAH